MCSQVEDREEKRKAAWFCTPRPRRSLCRVFGIFGRKSKKLREREREKVEVATRGIGVEAKAGMPKGEVSRNGGSCGSSSRRGIFFFFFLFFFLATRKGGGRGRRVGEDTRKWGQREGKRSGREKGG